MSPSELRAALANGENIMALLRKRYGTQVNTEEFIEISYDLRAGMETDLLKDPAHAQYVKESAAELARLLHQYGEPTSYLEAGVGEATTLSHLLQAYGKKQVNAHGFDLCWSRIYRARQWLAQEGVPGVSLCTGSLTRIPFVDNSFDVVCTVESVGENAEHEAQILSELYRVASRYLVLLEPAFELATPVAQARMVQHGYCRDLPGHAKQLGMRVVEYKLFPLVENPLNPLGLIVIEKEPTRPSVTPRYRCPKYHTPLTRHDQVYFGEDSFIVYPIVAQIPCLRAENAIVASLYGPEIAQGVESPGERA